MDLPQTAEELDASALEREALEELGEWALKWERRLQKGSAVHGAATRLKALADPERRQAA